MHSEIPNQWTSIEGFTRIIDAIGMIGDEVVTSPHFGRWRDGHIALLTARALGASHVRLIAEPQPDFVVRIGTDEFLYEATELLKPARRRHDEYGAALASAKLTQDDPEEHWIKADDFLTALRNRAVSKSEKNYPPGCHLVIYVNVGWISSRKPFAAPLEEMLGLEALRNAVHPALETFERVNLLHRGALTTL